MKTILPIIALLLVFSCKTTKPTAKDDVAVIRSILDQQQKAWSENDLEGFMSGYWESEDLTYFSRGKISKGWQTTLANYKRNYPTTKEYYRQ